MQSGVLARIEVRARGVEGGGGWGGWVWNCAQPARHAPAFDHLNGN